ncbi:hypothetical protein AKO1_004706, partial [Acrasis kona]
MTTNNSKSDHASLPIHTLHPVILPDQPPIPKLHHKLETVIENQGLHLLRNKNTYYFDKRLEKIHQPNDIDMNALSPFVTSSRDVNLNKLAIQHGCTYKCSTSSISPVLVPIFMMLTKFKSTNSRNLFSFDLLKSNYSPSVTKPNIFMLRRDPIQKQIFSIDSQHVNFIAPNNHILMELGKSLEKLLVMDYSNFEHEFLKINQKHHRARIVTPDTYRFLNVGKFIMRSQLDCVHHAVDGQEVVFDIKTRATHKIRTSMFQPNLWKRYTGSKPSDILGANNSYEREFYDMVRGAFLKYGVQARIGAMGGIFVAYHNTKEMLAFEHIKLSEIDEYTFGSSHMANHHFGMATSILEKMLDLITTNHPDWKTYHVLMGAKWNDSVRVFVNHKVNDLGWSEMKRSDSHQLPSFLEIVSDPSAAFAKYEELNLNTAVVYEISAKVIVNGNERRQFVYYDENDVIDLQYKIEHVGDTSNATLLGEYKSLLK